MILAADFGGTTIKLGLVHEGHVFAQNRIDAAADQQMSNRLETVAKEWELLLNKNGAVLKNCAGIVLALPFLTDRNCRRVHGSFEKFPGASEIDFDQWSRTRFGLPALVENDLRMALLGEWTAGMAQGKKDVVMLAFGTGIGCAVIANGQLLHGANNRAATLFGHSSIAFESTVGRCGNLGCAEDNASTATLESLAKARHDFANSKLACAARIDYETVFSLANQGDNCSQNLMQYSFKVWATLVQNSVIAYDPEIVVLGGGVLRSSESVIHSIREHLHRHMPGQPLDVPIVVSKLGDDAALIGCETLFNRHFSFS